VIDTLVDRSDGLRTRAMVFVIKGLGLCDYDVKRSFYRPDVARLPPDLAR
jgi:hypothetical protein